MKKLTLLIILFGLLTGSAFAQFIPRLATAGISTAKSILAISSNFIDGGGYQLNSQTVYVSPTLSLDFAANNAPSESDAAFVMPFACTIRNLNIRTGATPKSGTPVTVFTVRKNAADAAITVTMTETVNTTSTDSTHSVSFAAGDRFTLSAACTGASLSTGIVSITLEVDSP